MNKWNLTDDYTKLESIYIKKLLDIVSSFPTKNGYIGNQIRGVEGGGEVMAPSFYQKEKGNKISKGECTMHIGRCALATEQNMI